VTSEDGDRRFVNNPFARKLHPEPSRSFVARLALVVVSLLGGAIMGAAFLLPLGFAYGLLVGGVRGQHWSMVAVGVIVVGLYGLLLVSALRRRWGRKERS
jgi:hypothetical protein